ncbi:Glycine-rich domain-containing protein 2 [Nymphaea thermarum]|nr:Glycine-rich domain-containing protein 2 [Nymphaea thermarum]
MGSMTVGESAISENSSPKLKPGIRMSVDFVPAARKHVSFLRTVHHSASLHQTGFLSRAIRRYHRLWMPLYAQISDSSPLVLPPVDVQYIWFCHTLNPAAFRRYCMSRFSKVIEKPAIFDDENEEYAMKRCREIWKQRYPNEPIDPRDCPEDPAGDTDIHGVDLLAVAIKQLRFYKLVSDPFWGESSFLVSAKHRYRGFIYLLQKFRDGHSLLVPTIDILLIWITHQSFPASYHRDVGDMEMFGDWECMKEEDVKATCRLWEATFDHPYERAGVTFNRTRSPVYWEASAVDVNRGFKSLEPRLVTEACIFMKGNVEEGCVKKTFLRLKTIRRHKEFRIDRHVSSILRCSSEMAFWQKECQLWCELGTRGIAVELRRKGRGLFRSELAEDIVFSWKEVMRAPSLTVGRVITVVEKQGKAKLRVVVSMTPPVQAPYLLKCVPDRVTDDAGAMISDVILRMNKYRPQEGRWLSRTVLDHSGKECFVIRIRMAQGFWRRGGENPKPVKWEERIIQVCDGPWSYVADSIGIAPERIVGTATPKVDVRDEVLHGNGVIWSLSTGYELTIQWARGLDFSLENNTSGEHVRLLKGRKLQYQVAEPHLDEDDIEEGFVTLVRYSSDDPVGRATALLNWRFFTVEFLPEEDAATVLLVCTAIVRTVSDVKGEDVGNLLVRRRLKQAKAGSRDWGSVILGHDRFSQLEDEISSNVHLQPWHWNPKEVISLPEMSYSFQTGFGQSSNADGGDRLYQGGI